MAATEIPPQSHRRRPRWRSTLAAAGWALVAAYFLLAALVLGLRYWVLPEIGSHGEAIEQAVSKAIGKRVSIGGIEARWLGLRPEFELSQVEIYDQEGRVALSLPAVEAVLGWRSLPLMSLRLDSLAIEQPNLDIRRDGSGRLFVAGLEIEDGEAGGGLSSWLLSQGEIMVRNARISWDDERRAAPTLDLFGVTLVLRNSGDLHRVGLKAQVARELASALDIRAEVRGKDLSDLAEWRGLLFAELAYVDLAAWKRWVDYPVDVESGKGALRLWLAFERGRVTEATADVALAQVRTRLAPELPMLDLEYLQGRLGGADTGIVIDAQARRVALKTTGGVALPPADVTLHWERGAGKRDPKGELRATSLEIEPLVRLAEYLPLPSQLRRRLADHEPRGALHDLKLTWAGEADRPQRYAVRSRFSGVGVKAHESWGGFAGISGTLEASDAGGSVHIESQQAVLRLPTVLAEERAELDSLAARLSWTHSGGQLQLKVASASWANAQLAGTLQGTYSTRSQQAGGEGTVDLTATVQRMDGRAAWRYIPFLPRATQNYLRDAIVAGQLSDGRVRLKGDLRDFPFPDGKTGTFRVSARLANGELRTEGWPRVSDIGADIRLEGSQLRVHSARSTLMGARLSNVRAHVPDLYRGDIRLRLDGQAEGPTPDFLRFVRSSTLDSKVGPFIRTLSATGNGRLQLALSLPISGPSELKVAGTYDFANNQVSVAPDLPPLSQAGGRIEFTESTFGARNVSAQFLGGPAIFAVTARPEGAYTATGQGTASVAAVRKQFDLPQLDRASGHAGWHGTINASPAQFDLLLESPLTGVALALPPPFDKARAETLPLRLERSTRVVADFLQRARVQRLAPGGDGVSVSLGKLASGVFVRRRAGDGFVVERGALGLNEPLPPMPASGVAVSGRFAHLDFDRWRTPLESAGESIGSPVSNVTLAVTALDVMGKRLNDVKLRATPGKDAGWNADVASRELTGNVQWRPGGRGRVVARLTRLTIPEAAPAPAPQQTAGSELPAIDLVANEFTMRDLKLGRLEILAVNEARDWRIEKLSLTSPDSMISANGAWQSWATRPSVSLNVKLDVRDAGVFLTRMGYAGVVRGGTARLDGKVGWVGGPQAIDYPTLTGNVTLNAAKGQFLKAEPGIAKLLGILSLQSWVTLDFRELFGEGFAFETLSGTAQLSKGILTTDDFAMSGKSAQVSMGGAIDLAGETQRLRFRVIPSLGDGLSSVAGLLLANPVAGLGAMVAQRLFKDPLGRIFAYEYAVSGSWSEPVVERLGGQQRVGENPP